MSAIAKVFGRRPATRREPARAQYWFRVRAPSSNSVEQLATVPHNADAQVLQVLRRQVRQDHVVDLVLADCRLVPFEAKQPIPRGP
jgi:hypothetical protein